MKFLLRGWLPILLGVIIGLVAGMALQKAQTPKYTSSSLVLVQDTGVGTTTTVTGARTAGSVNLDTESNLVKSTAVLTATRSLLKSKDPLTTIAGRITVSVPPNSNLLKMMYEAGTPKAAQAGANDVAKAYLTNRGATAKALLAAQDKLIQTNYDSTNKALTKATADVLKYKSDSQDGQLAAASKALLTKKISSLSEQLIADQGVVITPGSITQAASLPTKPSGLSKTLFLASGLAMGVLLGLLGACLLARRPVTRVRRPDEVQESVGLPVIARIDGLEFGALAQAGTPAAESYRRLVNVITASLSGHHGIILVAGADDTQMASTVTHNIAATISRSGERVAVLRTGADSRDLATEGEAPPYRILPSAGPRTRLAIEDLRKQEDGYVLIDTPEPLRNADAQSYGTSADAVVIVVRTKTSAAHLRKVLAEFDAVAAPVLGTILVRTSGRKPQGNTVTGRQLQSAPNQAGSADGATDAEGQSATEATPAPRAQTPAPPAPTTSNGHRTSHDVAEDTALSGAARRVVRRNHRVRARADRD
jgi:succinoglycan biosynthesis transport protein ExoP